MVWIWMAIAHGASVTVGPGDDLSSLTSSLLAGDVVTFTAGRFEIEETLSWEALGESGRAVRFVGAPNGATTIVHTGDTGFAATLTGSTYVEITNLVFEGVDPKKQNVGGLRVQGSTNVTVENCVVRNVTGSGIRVDGDTNNIVLRLNEVAFTENGGGIVVGCDNGSCWMQDSLVEQNLIHDVGGTGLLFFRGTQNVQVLDNVVFRAGGDGLVLPDTLFGDQNLAQGNAIWQVEDDGIDITGPALVQNNVVFETGDEGIYSRDDNDSLVNVQISHNTIARTGGYGVWLRDWYDREQLVFANNVVSNSTGRSMLYEDPQSDPDYYKNNGVQPPETTNFITNNVVTGLVEGFDPVVRPTFVIEGGGVSDFVDIDNFDFYLSGVSQARDAGSPDGASYIPLVDFNRVDRDGIAPDAGAYEYVGGNENPGWVIAETFKDVTPASGVGTALNRGCCNRDDSADQAWIVAPLFLLALVRRRRE